MSEIGWPRRAVIITLACGLLTAVASAAQASRLGFSPQRVVMGPRDRTATLRLTNRGKSTASYRISMIDVIYRDNGRIEHARRTPAGFPSAKRLIRFSPRQVRLRPGQTQTIRVLLRRARALRDGEYRVHAVLRKLPDVSGVKNPSARRGRARGGIGVSQAVALPIIVRRGSTRATGSIRSVRVRGGRVPKLDIQLARRGNQSLYTNLRLRDARGRPVQLVKGVALPVPNSRRRLLWPVKGVSGAQLRSGRYTLDLLDHKSGKIYSSVKFR